MNFFFFFFFFGLVSLIYIRKHLLLCLLSLEFIVLSLLLMVFKVCLSFESFYLYIMFMTFFVCEGVLGLSILVNMIRFHGNDYLSSIYLW
uniref:NADH dehydrogenase subunit 4L n=1 Tax=Macropsis perpetua TaxID=3035248 RepID=UPI00241110BF|nr:NADH dehydrogenase subunit 4L [Macropsis perpetua]YP_010736867.1 NADH dehydrogenase subunit 4L [Macropsis ocellata]WEP24728.1 NADH dehydrogenase subunit 4L [Macropsis perpetua]WEP24741.1 NADH dehydrogenase subunit 4L [Macropsis ocellata]